MYVWCNHDVNYKTIETHRKKRNVNIRALRGHQLSVWMRGLYRSETVTPGLSFRDFHRMPHVFFNLWITSRRVTSRTSAN